MKCELASIKIVLKYVKSPICNTKTLLAEVFSTLLETRQFPCKSKSHFLKPTYLPIFINFTTGKASTSSHFHLPIFINFTKAKHQLRHVFIFTCSSTSRQVKHQLRHVFIFTFSSTSRKQSINFVTFSSSHFHQLHERKASTSSHFHLPIFINFTTGKASTSSRFHLHFGPISARKEKRS